MPSLSCRMNCTGVCIVSVVAALGAGALGTPSETRPSTRAAREQVDDERFQRELLGDGPSSAAGTGGKVRELMGESAKRLSASDPGEATQYVQEQIVQGIDRLIEELSRRPAPARPKGQPGPGGDQGRAPADAGSASAPGDARGDAAGGNAGGSDRVSPGEDFRSAAETWGKISPKLRGPVVEGRSERVMGKYKSLVEDYYRAVAVKAAE